ncbi:MAG: RluA family pseudouridine synthase [Bacteroidetes bacterium]|nr:RluA family pseudouridine synthase [Bacteroidota bacterium]
MKIEILLETDDYIVINKQAEMLTIPDRYQEDILNYKSILAKMYQNIFVVHRLDIGTSGCLLFAKNADFHKHINIQFENHTIKKNYIAVLNGNLPNDITIDIRLLSNYNKAGVICSARGKECITHLKILKRYTNATLVDAQLETGRLHQLRAHCKAIGYPLLVDEMYGNRKIFFVSEIKKGRYNLKKGETERPIISRPTMHASKLSFTDITNENIVVEAPLPKDMRALINVLEKHCKS